MDYQVLIMTTYYAAQLGIALSVVDSRASYIKEKEERQLLDESAKTAAGSIGAVRQRRLNAAEN